MFHKHYGLLNSYTTIQMHWLFKYLSLFLSHIRIYQDIYSPPNISISRSKNKNLVTSKQNKRGMRCPRAAILLSLITGLSTHIQFDFRPFPFLWAHFICTVPCSQPPKTDACQASSSYLLQFRYKTSSCQDPFLKV